MHGVSVERLSFAYGHDAPAVDGIDLFVDAGEIVAVVGPSGSGKTTLLRLISGLLRPSHGRVVVGGADVAGIPPERRPVAMVFQGFALFPHLDVAANIGFGLRVRKVAREQRDARVREVADLLGLAALLHRTPAELSGGERQRVALGRALVRDPVVFLLDEPLSSLDPLLRASARRDLDVLLRRDGRCALYVTHDQAEAMTLADRVVVVRDGRVEQTGTPRELYDSPATAFVASFVGDPPMSLLHPGAAGIGGPAGASMLGVRAEHVAVGEGDDATVIRLDDMGHEVIAELDCDGTVLLARLPRTVTAERGARVGVAVDPAHVHAFDEHGLALR